MRHWRSVWLSTSLAPGRSANAAHLSIPDASHTLRADDSERAKPLAAHPVPGSRLVLTVQVSANALDGPPWLPAWAAHDLVPEIAHLCEPVPGEPQFSTWLRASGAVCNQGWYTAGCVLARRLSPADMTGCTITVPAQVKNRGPYFPLPTGAGVPLPLTPGSYQVADVAAAFGVSIPDVVQLLDELFWAGVVILSRATG
jgi:hypothetical protein